MFLLGFKVNKKMWPLSIVPGIVTDARSTLPVNGGLFIGDSNWYLPTQSTGAYYRIAVPGTYEIIVTAPGYVPTKVNVTVEDGKNKCFCMFLNFQE